VQYFKGNRQVWIESGDIVYVKDYKILTKPTWRRAVVKKS